jgi:ADP-heptose:LPS heptosyltransferase
MKEKRVLLVRVGKLGDTIWGVAPIDGLMKYYGPDVKIDLVVKNGMAGLFAHDPRVYRVFEITKKRLPLLLSPAKLQVLWHSIRAPYDLALDMETEPFFRSLFLLLRAKKKMSAYKIRHDLRTPTEHAVLSVRKIARLAISQDLAEAVAPKLVVTRGSGRNALIPVEGNYICLHLGNSWIASGREDLRAWPRERWRQLLQEWSAYFPNHVPVILGTAFEKGLAASITAGLEGCIDLCGKTDMQQMMDVISGSDAFIGTDTGPTHMAAAIGVPVVSVFGPTRPQQTGPFADGSNLVEILSANLPCSPCVHTSQFRTCERNRCMEAVTPAMVANAVRAIIQLRQHRSPW